MNQPTNVSPASIIRKKSAVEQFFARHQQWVIGLVVMPASFINSAYCRLMKHFRSLGRRKTPADVVADHQVKVERVSFDVMRWLQLPASQRPPIRSDRSSAASHSVRTTDKSGSYPVAMQDFNQILGIDLEKGTITVEPYVTVGELTSYLLQHDRMLEATLEMEDATLGGLALSQGMTTHSHRCGLVHDTVVRFEFVTGMGECIQATATDNVDVYNSAGFSHGTLGFLTALELRIVPASRELLVSYHHFRSAAALQQGYQNSILDTDAFFLEAIVYSRDHAVLIRGDLLTDTTRRDEQQKGTQTNHQGRWYKPWFFCYAEKVPDGHREFMPMRDYLMRHDRSMCMTMLYVFPAANHPLMRWLLGWMLPPKVTFLKALRPPQARVDVATEQTYQDLAFPMEKLDEMLQFVDEHFGIFPLLVYPCRLLDRGGFIQAPNGIPCLHENGVKEQYFLNLGIYGIPRAVAQGDRQYNVIAETRKLLAKVRELGGFQHSYCDVFQTQDEFYSMFDQRLAQSVRKRLGSENWMTVYEKVQPEIPWQEWS